MREERGGCVRLRGRGRLWRWSWTFVPVGAGGGSVGLVFSDLLSSSHVRREKG